MTLIPDVVKARRLEIVNALGSCVISLDCWDDGKPFIRLYDVDGRERLVFSLNHRDQPQIGLLTPEGATIVGIGVNDDLGCGLNLFDTNGILKIVIAVTSDGTPIVKEVE
jgi:hypothetical protein